MAVVAGDEPVRGWSRGGSNLTSALAARERLLLVVRLCTWLGRDFTIGMGSAAILARSCA